MKALFKERLKQALDYRGMKAVDLCEKGGFPQSAISYYLSGRSVPKNDRLYMIAKILDVSEAWLLGYNVKMERDSAQKELDELASLYERIKKDPDFKRLALQLNHLNPEQIDAITNLLLAFQQ